MKTTLKTALGAALILGALASTASAHATLEASEAPAGSYYKAIIRIPHGCDGQATEQVDVQVPEGFIGVKPMPHAGWELSTEIGAYQNTYQNHGREVTEGVLNVTWSGGNLPSDWYDEFVMRGKLADTLETGSVLWFKVVQTCADGTVAWENIPADGQTAHDVRHPALGLHITAGGHHGH